MASMVIRLLYRQTSELKAEVIHPVLRGQLSQGSKSLGNTSFSDSLIKV